MRFALETDSANLTAATMHNVRYGRRRGDREHVLCSAIGCIRTGTSEACENMRVEQHIPGYYECPHAIPGHLLYVTGLLLTEQSIQVEYTITPPLPEVDLESGREAMLEWECSAEDDVSNVFALADHAQRLSENGERTEGVLALTPPLAPGARMLRVFLAPLPESEHERELLCDFEVHLVLREIRPTADEPPEGWHRDVR